MCCVFDHTKTHVFDHVFQMVNIKIRLIIFFVAKDGEALYNQPKQVLEGLVGVHRTVQLHLLQYYWLGHRLGLL